jgi:hypothetical protein
MYYTSIPLAVLNDPRFARRYSNNDAPRLREIRKRLESDLPMDEVDEVRSVLRMTRVITDGLVQIAHDLMDEIVPLASDYLGNTLVQKVRCDGLGVHLPADSDFYCSFSSRRRRPSARPCSSASRLISRRSGSS